MKQQTVYGFKSAFDYVFVRAMNRVARLKSDYPMPAFLSERLARLSRV
jgi:hypothetical protein